MKIRKVLMEGKFSIIVSSDTLIMKGDMLVLNFQEADRYFKVSKLETDGDFIDVTATEIGYYNKLENIKQFDIRDLAGLDVKVVADIQTKRKVENESRLL